MKTTGRPAFPLPLGIRYMLALFASIKGTDLTAARLAVLPSADTISVILKQIGSTTT
jgi:hypothetical protein